MDASMGEGLISTRRNGDASQGPGSPKAASRHVMVVGVCPRMRAVVRALERLAAADVSVVFTGETGTGKELAARTIHQLSERKNGPFVPVNCGAIPKTLVESELFGHERGAFTGAVRRKTGFLERAHRGTLFLDEVGEMPEEFQVKLLRVLDDGWIQRVGGETPFRVDMRVLAATNRDLQSAVRKGTFRDDLYWRLGGGS